MGSNLSWVSKCGNHFYIVLCVWLVQDVTRLPGALQLDQSHELSQSVGGLISVTDFTPAQVFLVEQAGLLSQIDLQIRREDDATSDAALEIWATSGGVPTGSSPLFTQAIPNSQIPALPNVPSVPLTSIDVSNGGLQVVPGEQYMIALRSFGTFDDPVTSWAWGSPAYAGGDPYSSAFGRAWKSEGSDYDFAFRTWVNVLAEGLTNGDFETGALNPWAAFDTVGGNTSFGYPRVESFDVTGDGTSTPAAKIRVGSNDPGFMVPPEGGGILQQFDLSQGGDYRLSVDIAVALEQDFGNTGPGQFDLLFDGAIVATVDYNGTTLNPGEVIRDHLSASLDAVSPGTHEVALQVLRNATNSREVYQYLDNFSLVPISADFDEDGDVDGRDFLIWQRNAGLPSPSAGDGNADGIVNEDDLQIWQARYASDGSSALIAVPEPTGSAIALGFPIALCWASGRARFSAACGR